MLSPVKMIYELRFITISGNFFFIKKGGLGVTRYAFLTSPVSSETDVTTKADRYIVTLKMSNDIQSTTNSLQFLNCS